MEKTASVGFAKKFIDWIMKTIGGSSCPLWIFANKTSADNDLKDKFEVVDDETKD